MVNPYFHLIRRKSLSMNDFELTVPDLYFSKIFQKTLGKCDTNKI